MFLLGQDYTDCGFYSEYSAFYEVWEKDLGKRSKLTKSPTRGILSVRSPFCHEDGCNSSLSHQLDCRESRK